MTEPIDDLRIKTIHDISTPEEVRREIPITPDAARVVVGARETIHNILHGKDKRLLAVVGPCSIHDVKACTEYAERLCALRNRLIDDLFIVMRVYFEKPRTRTGWKGLINDPNLDNTFHINHGIRLARRFLLNLGALGQPAGTEYLDLISPQYLSDLVSWAAIGARTTESQGHRELASGASCPVGFKNGTDGNLNIAVDAIAAAASPHRFLSMKKDGRAAIFATAGNRDCHLILRGGLQPNYDAASVANAAALLQKAGLRPTLMVDCSHANSKKSHKRQLLVLQDVTAQIAAGSAAIRGLMIESHLVAGRQDGEGRGLAALTYGQSITDQCIGWDDTERGLEALARAARRGSAAAV